MPYKYSLLLLFIFCHFLSFSQDMQKGFTYLETGKYQNAETFFTDILKDYPKKLILGGGSNMLITKDINALVVHISLKGISIISENDDFVTIKANAGENWHEFVLWCFFSTPNPGMTQILGH